jgi:hypothetical protein
MNQVHLRNMLEFAAEVIPTPNHTTAGQRHPNQCKQCKTVGSVYTHPEMEIHIQKERGVTLTATLPSWRECRFCHAQDTI